jgi:broad specificity phosphatase PhoE
MPEKSPEKEITKEYGRNIRQRDIYFRHGEKTTTGELAPAGYKRAEKIGKSLKVAQHDIKGYYSPWERTEQFTKTIIDATKKVKKFSARQRLELGRLKFSETFLHKIMQIREKEGANAAVQYYLGYEKQRPEKNLPSPKEIAADMAKHVLTHIKMTERYYNGSKVDLINGTHRFCIEPFLKEAIGEEIEKNPVNPKGKTFVEKLGGSMDFGQGFEIDTVIDSQGRKSVKLLLRGKEYPVDTERLTRLIEKYYKKEKGKK